MDREMWILRQLETSLTASAEALAERLQVSPRTITNAINTLNRMPVSYTHLTLPTIYSV